MIFHWETSFASVPPQPKVPVLLLGLFFSHHLPFPHPSSNIFTDLHNISFRLSQRLLSSVSSSLLCCARDGDQRHGQDGAIPGTRGGSDVVDVGCDGTGGRAQEIWACSSYSCGVLPAVRVEGRVLLRPQDT